MEDADLIQRRLVLLFSDIPRIVPMMPQVHISQVLRPDQGSFGVVVQNAGSVDADLVEKISDRYEAQVFNLVADCNGGERPRRGTLQTIGIRRAAGIRCVRLGRVELGSRTEGYLLRTHIAQPATITPPTNMAKQ